MTPICHIESSPRVPGDSLRGKRPHDYGRGRVCTQPGCTTILRRTHKGPVCDPCQDNDHVAAPRRGAVAARRPHKPEIAGSNPAAATNQQSGPPASADSEAVATAAPAARAKKGETVGKESRREAVLLAFARDPSRRFSAGDVVKASGISPSCVYKNLKALVASGDLVKEAPGEYRWPTITDATSSEGEESAKTAPDLIPPAPAPATEGPTPEHAAGAPADPAPAPAPETPLEPVPAAGDLDYFNGLRRDWYDGKVEMDVDQLFAFATRMRDELLGKLTSIQQCHVYRLPVVAGDLATGEVGVHWIDGLDQSEVSAAIHDSKAPRPYESVDWEAGPPEPPAAGLRPFAGIVTTTLVGYSMSRELRILDGLEGLDDDARERVLQYAVDRWWLK